MPELLDLPNEILRLIWRELPLSALLETSVVSNRIHESSLPYICQTFQQSSSLERTRKRLRNFFQVLKKYPFVRPQVRSIIIDDMLSDQSMRMLRSLIIPLLSFTPNLQQLAIPGSLETLSSLPPALKNGTVSLQSLQELRCVYCYPKKIWEMLSFFPQLCSLSLKNLRSDESLLQLSTASLPIQTIILELCDFNSTAICALIKSCKRLKSFQYFQYVGLSQERDPSLMNWNTGMPYLDVGEIHKALLLHKNSLEELVIQGHDYGMPYERIPKFGSFEDFTSLISLGVDYYNISQKLPLPPALNSVALRQCSKKEGGSTAEVRLVTVHLGMHPSLKNISIDDIGSCLFFRRQQEGGHLRNEIQLHIPFYYPSYSEFDSSNVVTHPLRWIGPSELRFLC
ncbi:hypothetical protein DPV78_003458 [Talaromyces pinophilus]|nr:hypothetical protein DPV78_003458 [Talaromyces pinophilus]